MRWAILCHAAHASHALPQDDAKAHAAAMLTLCGMLLLFCALPCRLQDDFKAYAAATQGFAWVAQRPEAATTVEQKWGYQGASPGDWLELEFSTVQDPGSGSSSSTSSSSKSDGGSGGGDDSSSARPRVFLGYLRRWLGGWMGGCVGSLVGWWAGELVDANGEGYDKGPGMGSTVQ